MGGSEIEVPNVTGHVLERILEFCQYYHDKDVSYLREHDRMKLGETEIKFLEGPQEFLCELTSVR